MGIFITFIYFFNKSIWTHETQCKSLHTHYRTSQTVMYADGTRCRVESNPFGFSQKKTKFDPELCIEV